MNDSKIPVRYSKALFDLALEKNVLDNLYEDMQLILAICSMKDVRQVIDNPVIPPEKRKEILNSLFPVKLEPLTGKFIDLIFEHGRESYFVSTVRDFIGLTRKHRNIRQITITTAVPVSDKVREKIASYITGDRKEKLEFIEQVDNAIGGGFILRVDDSYIDASVRSRLNKFKKEFSLAGFAEK